MLKDIFTSLLSSEVILDPYLAEMLLHKSEGDRGTLPWDEVFTRYRFTVKGPPKDILDLLVVFGLLGILVK